jgi:hypothetical protein
VSGTTFLYFLKHFKEIQVSNELAANTTDVQLPDAIMTDAPVEREFFKKYSPEWREVLGAVLRKVYLDKSFFNAVIKDFAENNLATSNFAKDAMKSFRAGIAVYGKLSTKTPEGLNRHGEPKLSQFELAMSILRDHPSILVERYAKDVGVDLDNEPLPY